MEQARAASIASAEITTTSVENEISSHKDELVAKLEVIETKIDDYRMKLEFLEGTRQTLSRAISVMDDFLYPPETVERIS